MRSLIKQVLSRSEPAKSITVKGWVRTRRDSKEFSFIELNDGSCIGNIQCIADNTIPGYEFIQKMNTGAAVGVTGELIPSKGKGQKWEIQAHSVSLIGEAPEDFPLQKKGHTPEFLRTIPHLRPRTNLYGAVFRMRSRLALAIHRFFEERCFTYVHTPIITSSDCEGAGELFRVTALDPSIAASKGYGEDFFKKSTYLTVSGQLEGETFATALSNIYTFGPTFRAENSHTTRHASEFWMVEPEMAFCDLFENMDLAEEFLTYLIKDTLDKSADDLTIFNKFVDKSLISKLEAIVDNNFERLSYTEAVSILEKSGETFEYPVEWGVNLQSEHERFLCEKHTKSPLTVYNYPKSIKPFYMKTNECGETVTAMDLLVPGIGEIIGGAQREDELSILMDNMNKSNLDLDHYSWYTDLRKFGSCPHSGFGMGFERLLMFVTGMKNIRDVIAFPRTPGNCS